MAGARNSLRSLSSFEPAGLAVPDGPQAAAAHPLLYAPPVALIQHQTALLTALAFVAAGCGSVASHGGPDAGPHATVDASEGSGDGPVAFGDIDGDGSPDGVDNCPAVANPDQADTDGDSFGVGAGVEEQRTRLTASTYRIRVLQPEPPPTITVRESPWALPGLRTSHRSLDTEALSTWSIDPHCPTVGHVRRRPAGRDRARNVMSQGCGWRAN